MRLDVLLGEAHVTPAEVVGRVVVVVDVLRAATTVATALANGARAVIPFEHVDEVAIRAKQFERSDVRLGGERKMQRIPGFDLGNSPAEYTRSAVDGRTILYSTTNGTAALVASQGSRACFFAGFVNLRATIAAVRAATRSASVPATETSGQANAPTSTPSSTQGDSTAARTGVTILCSGTDRRVALEDVVCAGLLARGITRSRAGVVQGDAAYIARTLSRRYDANLSRVAEDSAHAQALLAAGFSDDVARCFEVDAVPIAVSYHDRQLLLHQSRR